MKQSGAIRYTLHVTRPAFTLIELLVSISIFALITTAVVANFRAGERSDELRLAAEQFASTLREIETETQTGVALRGGYEIHVIPGASPTVQIFTDSGNGLGGAGDKRYNANVGEERSRLIPGFPAGVRISGIVPAGGALDVLFEPPTPTIWINGAQSDLEARIILHHDRTGQDRAVVIKRLSGRIEISN